MEWRLPAKAGSFFSGVARGKGSKKRTQMRFAVCWIVVGCVEMDGNAVFLGVQEEFSVMPGGGVFPGILSYLREFCCVSGNFGIFPGILSPEF